MDAMVDIRRRVVEDLGPLKLLRICEMPDETHSLLVERAEGCALALSR